MPGRREGSIGASVAVRWNHPRREPLFLQVRSVAAALRRTRTILFALVVLGVVLRLATFSSWGIVYDGAEYAVMGDSLLKHGEFIVPYASGIQYYHHYGPLYPAYLAPFYAVFGFSAAVTKLAGLVMSVVFIAVAYATTKDLLGRTKAWFVAAFVALEPMFLITTAIGYSDDLVGLLFVATVWAVIKSLKAPRYVLLAGFLAGLGFLAKAPIGYVFVLAGVAGLAWRVRYRGWGVLKDRWYLSGMAVFGVLAGSWSVRNLARFGWPNWGTSAELDYAYGYGMAHPAILATGLIEKIPWFLLIFLFYGGLFLPELRRSFRRVREEETSALWLAVVLVFVMGWIVSTFFWMVEDRPIWWWDNARYGVIAAPVLLWAALREVPAFSVPISSARPPLRSFRNRFLILMAIFVGIGLIIVAFPAPYSHIEALQDIGPYLRPGDTIAVDGISLEAVLPYVSGLDVTVVRYHAAFNGSFVLSAYSTRYGGYALTASFNGQDLLGEVFVCNLWTSLAMVKLLRSNDNMSSGA